MCTFVQHLNWITKHVFHLYCKGIHWARLTIYDQNKWRAVSSRVYTIHGVLDQSDHCSRSRTHVPLIWPGQKLRQIARLRNPTPYCSRTFIMTRVAIAYLPQPQPAFLSQLSNYQVDSITQNCIFHNCLEIHGKGCFVLLPLSFLEWCFAFIIQ